MKTIILASVFISALASSACADQICGTLGSHAERPHCDNGMACPMIVTLQYDLIGPNEARYNIQTTDSDVLLSLGALNGAKVCVEGTQDSGTILADSVVAQ
jgi:hypothetical protein